MKYGISFSCRHYFAITLWFGQRKYKFWPVSAKGYLRGIYFHKESHSPLIYSNEIFIGVVKGE